MAGIYHRQSPGGILSIPRVPCSQQKLAEDQSGPKGAFKPPHSTASLNIWLSRRGRTCRTFTYYDPYSCDQARRPASPKGIQKVSLPLEQIRTGGGVVPLIFWKCIRAWQPHRQSLSIVSLLDCSTHGDASLELVSKLAVLLMYPHCTTAQRGIT